MALGMLLMRSEIPLYDVDIDFFTMVDCNGLGYYIGLGSAGAWSGYTCV